MKNFRTILRRVRSLPDLSIRQLEYLVAVAEEDTWALAAERVGVSASALSQGLAELERRVGVALFEPDGRRRRVRGSALPVLEHARHVLALTSDLMGWSDRLRGARAGRVRVGMIDVAAVVHFADAIAAFKDERPDVELTLSVAPSAQLLDDLRDGRLDLAVCVSPPQPRPGLELDELLSEQLVVIAPPGTTIGAPSSWGPWVTFPGGSHTRQLITDALARVGAPVVIAAESHQPDVLLQMVRLGFGWTALPAATPMPAADRVVVGPELVGRVIVLARRAGSIHDPSVDELGRMLAHASTEAVTPARRREEAISRTGGARRPRRSS